MSDAVRINKFTPLPPKEINLSILPTNVLVSFSFQHGCKKDISCERLDYI